MTKTKIYFFSRASEGLDYRILSIKFWNVFQTFVLGEIRVLKVFSSEAKAKQIGPPKGKSSWSAITYSEYWSQRISFAISQCNAQAVLNAIKKISYKQTVAELTQSTGGTQ